MRYRSIIFLLLGGLLTGDLLALSLDNVLSNIDQQTDSVKLFILSLSYVIGVGLCISGIMKLKKYGTRTAFMAVETSMIGPLLQFFIGVMLFYFADFLSAINMTFYNTTTFATTLSYETQTTSTYSNYIKPVFHVVQIIGMISFIRGWVQLSRVTGAGQSQPGAISKAVTHIVAGSLAMNVYEVFNVVHATITNT